MTDNPRVGVNDCQGSRDQQHLCHVLLAEGKLGVGIGIQVTVNIECTLPKYTLVFIFFLYLKIYVKCIFDIWYGG